VFLKNPLCSNRRHSTSFYSFPEILSRLERALQDLSKDVKSVDRGQELIELHLSKVGLLFDFSLAYSPRPPKEIVALRHYSSARLTVTACSFNRLTAFCSTLLISFKAVKGTRYQRCIAHLSVCSHSALQVSRRGSSRALCDNNPTGVWQVSPLQGPLHLCASHKGKS